VKRVKIGNVSSYLDQIIILVTHVVSLQSKYNYRKYNQIFLFDEIHFKQNQGIKNNY